MPFRLLLHVSKGLVIILSFLLRLEQFAWLLRLHPVPELCEMGNEFMKEYSDVDLAM